MFRPARWLPLSLAVVVVLAAGATLAQTRRPAATPAATSIAAIDRAAATIRPAAMRAHMTFLADDLLEGRGTATRGYDIAARYVASHFEQAGLLPGGTDSTWYQPVPLLQSRIVESECRVTLVRGGESKALAYETDYLMSADPLRERSTIEGEAVFVGYGVTAPEQGYDDYAGVDARGKIVVMLSGAPPKFAHTQRAFHSWGHTKSQNAAAHGAIGIVTVRKPDDEARSPWARSVRQNRLPGYRWTDAEGAPNDVFPQLETAITLARPVAEWLFQGAEKSLEQVFADADKGQPMSFALPVRIQSRRASAHARTSSPNVAGLLRGSDPKLRDEYVVLTAHLDHLGISTPVDGDSINNGYYDNGSGIAALIEIARAMKAMGAAPRRSVIFLAVTAEEKGLQGADYFARNPTVPRGAVVANVNMDMFLGLSPLRNVILFGGEHTTMGPLAERIAKRMGIGVVPDPVPAEVIFVRSDQFPFVRQGIPAIYPDIGLGINEAAGEGHDDRWMKEIYHGPQDEIGQTVHWDSMARFARFVFAIGAEVANGAKAPAWNAGDYFGTRFARGD
jgi:hypothetical protein